MDGQRFDDLTRVLGLSLNRKRFLAFVAGIVAPVAADGLEEVGAKKKGGKGKRRRRNRRRDNGHVGGQGNTGGVCEQLCSGSVPDPQFCGSFGNCGSDADCIAQDPSRPICCTASPGCGGPEEGACCASPQICGGECLKDSDCDVAPDCVCDEDAGFCRTVICGGECSKTDDCPPLSGCVCELNNNAERVGTEQLPGHCVLGTCGGPCTDDNDCLDFTPNCLCDIPAGASQGDCVTVACAGGCLKDIDCPRLVGCVCTVNIDPVRAVAEGLEPGECFTEACPGFCNINDDCTRRGAPDCVCFEGRPNQEVVPEGEFGFCETCRTTGESCRGSNECCGQLVCEGVSASGANGPAGTCRQKTPPPPRRCRKHGQSCNNDRECCAQGQCYQGKCGEKDTHCHHDRECARGYRCQGGRLSPGHRRCRKNGKRKQHLAHKRRWRR